MINTLLTPNQLGTWLVQVRTAQWEAHLQVLANKMMPMPLARSLVAKFIHTTKLPLS